MVLSLAYINGKGRSFCSCPEARGLQQGFGEKFHCVAAPRRRPAARILATAFAEKLMRHEVEPCRVWRSGGGINKDRAINRAGFPPRNL
jgi:hypothetical protein